MNVSHFLRDLCLQKGWLSVNFTPDSIHYGSHWQQDSHSIEIKAWSFISRSIIHVVSVPLRFYPGLDKSVRLSIVYNTWSNDNRSGRNSCYEQWYVNRNVRPAMFLHVIFKPNFSIVISGKQKSFHLWVDRLAVKLFLWATGCFSEKLSMSLYLSSTTRSGFDLLTRFSSVDWGSGSSSKSFIPTHGWCTQAFSNRTLP